MRTADEIFQDEFSDCEMNNLTDTAKRFICDAIRAGMKEAIEEMIYHMNEYSMEWTGTYSKAKEIKSSIK